jgi:hypothetical protein
VANGIGGSDERDGSPEPQPAAKSPSSAAPQAAHFGKRPTMNRVTKRFPSDL